MKNTLSDYEMTELANKAISELVYPKTEIQKAYNYYNGIRDADQFRHLEENYGIGSPVSIVFTPLIKKHIDAIANEYTETAVIPKVTCKDSETITSITREMELKISDEIANILKSQLNNSILQFVDGKTTVDPLIEKQLELLIDELESDYISNYEVAAQNIIEYLMQSRSVDFKNKRKQLIMDLLTAGYNYYRVRPTIDKTNIEIEVLDTRNVFTDINVNSWYVKDSKRAVVRSWLNKSEILTRYGKDLSKEDIEKIEKLEYAAYSSSAYYVRTYSSEGTHGIDSKEFIPGYPDDNGRAQNLIPVYEVEWIEVDKDFVMQRYEVVRIGSEIFILYGKNEEVIRSKDSPQYCSLSINGLYILNRHKQPYSLVLACVDLQDKYDIINFFRDCIIANSGVAGDFLDVSMLPTELGSDLTERIIAYQAYKKQGVALINSSQEGRQYNNNTTVGGFDDTVKAQTIQGIELVLERIENTCSSITGVFRERLNGISQKDAVSNVKVGVQNSYTITAQFTQQMDSVTIEILSDALNLAKVVYSKGLTGVLVLGDLGQKIFTADPKYYTTTDFNVHIISGSEVAKDIETVKNLIYELIKGNNVDAEIIIEAVSAKSLTELKRKIKRAMKKKKDENNQLMSLQQQNQELQQQLQQMQSELQKAQSKLEALNENKIQLESQKLQMENQIAWFNARTDRDYKQAISKTQEKKVDVEVGQLYDNNPYNDKIRND